MAFKYALYPSNITRNKDDHIARSNDNPLIELQDVIDKITVPGSILKDTECRAVIHEFFRIIGENLSEGVGLKSAYLNIQPGIGGIFDGDKDKFDPERHRKQVRISAGKALKKAVQKLEVEKVDSTEVRPVPKAVFDFSTRIKNQFLSPGNALQIYGSLLKYNAALLDEGVFFISTKTRKEVQSDIVTTNLPSQLLVGIPESLPGGKYYLEVRARIGNSKTLTIGRLERLLKVK